MADDPEVHRRGVRASDKGFLSLDWHQYLALLRWTAKQSVTGQVGKMPKRLRGIRSANDGGVGSSSAKKQRRPQLTRVAAGTGSSDGSASGAILDAAAW